ncbi:hypothetical protein NC99_16750 [Sunxiuqinia dokdonensis]|uniref:Uncharacterized protein n=1 Tax=Sunxiuqinia dokdonensis TaxID=1409788 RepID=A0A0L8VAN7_9BACT|nr:hypothetical protein NC99_16750 [Sunxiuqinia dokdonensis]
MKSDSLPQFFGTEIGHFEPLRRMENAAIKIIEENSYC